MDADLLGLAMARARAALGTDRHARKDRKAGRPIRPREFRGCGHAGPVHDSAYTGRVRAELSLGWTLSKKPVRAGARIDRSHKTMTCRTRAVSRTGFHERS